MNRGTDGFRLDTVNFFAYDQKLRDNPQRDPSEPILEKGQANNPYFHQNTIFSKDRPENLEFIHFLREPVSYTHLRAHETPEPRGWRGVG